MTKTVTESGSTKNIISYHAEVPFLSKPKIIGERFIDGVKYYYNELKEYQAERFDSFWKCNKEEIKPAQYKGKTIGQDLYFTV